MNNLVIDAATGSAMDDNGFIADWLSNAVGNRDHANPADAVSASRVDSVARAFSGAIQRSGQRADAFGGDGYHFARELEHNYGRLLEEKKPPLNAQLLFPVDRSVPVGARSHKVERESVQGEAHIYRGGSGDDAPRVEVSKLEEAFPVRHIVTSIWMNLFDEQASTFANSGMFARKMAGARKIIDRKWNTLAWDGHAASALKGVLNYPWLAKLFSALVYNGSATAAQYLEDLSTAANWAAENSRDVFSPSVMVTTSRIKNMLQRTNMGLGTDTSILAYFLTNQNYVTRVVVANELMAVGPGGEDGILFYRDDADSISNVVIGAPVNFLPAERRGFSTRFIAWGSTGGTIMRDVGHNLLMFAATA